MKCWCCAWGVYTQTTWGVNQLHWYSISDETLLMEVSCDYPYIWFFFIITYGTFIDNVNWNKSYWKKTTQ